MVKRFISLVVSGGHKLSGQVVHKLTGHKLGGQAVHKFSGNPAVNPISAGSHGTWWLCTLLQAESSSLSMQWPVERFI